MTVPSWISQPDVWDVVTLGRWTLPGIASVKIKRSRKVEKKEGKDSGGATSTVKGPSVADVMIELRTWDPKTIDEDLALLEDFLANNDPRNGISPGPLDIAHPQAELRKVSAILIEEIEGPDPADASSPGAGVWVTKIKSSEYSPPKASAAKTPTASTPYTTATSRAGKEGPPPANPTPPPDEAGPPPPP